MNRKWLTWTAMAGVSAVLTFTTMGLASAGQNDPHDANAHTQRDQNRRDNQGTGSHDNQGGSQATWNMQHRRRSTATRTNGYSRANSRYHHNQGTTGFRNVNGDHGNNGHANHANGQSGNWQNGHNGNSTAGGRSNTDRAHSVPNGHNTRSHDRTNNGGDQH